MEGLVILCGLRALLTVDKRTTTKWLVYSKFFYIYCFHSCVTATATAFGLQQKSPQETQIKSSSKKKEKKMLPVFLVFMLLYKVFWNDYVLFLSMDDPVGRVGTSMRRGAPKNKAQQKTTTWSVIKETVKKQRDTVVWAGEEFFFFLN